MSGNITLGFMFIVVLTAIFMSVILDRNYNRHLEKLHEEHEEELKKKGYIKPQFKELTQEQIDDIHARGKITPAEKVREWEGMDLCAPGDAIGSAAWRCKKFDNCHDCLVDYASSGNEYTSIKDIMKEIKIQEI